MLIDHMAQGYSFESFAADINTHHQVLYGWAERNPEFCEAKKEAFDKCRKFWEKLGTAGTVGKIKNFSPAMWIYNMKCRFPKQWHDLSVAKDNGIDVAQILLNYAPKVKTGLGVEKASKK